MPQHVAPFTLAFLLLALGALFLAGGVGYVARRCSLSPLAVGLAVATPVLAVSLTAALQGRHRFALGLITGSTVVNVTVALGLAALVRPLAGNSRAVTAAISALLVAVLLFWFVCRDNGLSRVDGSLLLLGFAAAVLYVRREAAEEAADAAVKFEEWGFRARPVWSAAPIAVIGVCLLVYGAVLLVPEATEIANKQLKVNSRLFAVTAVALACSPALLWVVGSVARNGHADLALGTVVGANLCNVLLVPGVTALVVPLLVTDRAVMDDIPAMVLASFLLLIPFLNGLRVSRPEGAILLAVYAAFFTWQVRR